MRHTRRLIYGTTLTSAATGAGIILASLTTSNPTTAVAGLALCFTSLLVFRMVYEQATLRQQRRNASEQERLLQAERSIFERDTERARRELHDREQELAESSERERETLHRQVADERDQLLTECADLKAAWERAAFRKGFEMGENGIGEEIRPADVIYLPFPSQERTIMGTGTTHK